ncbi:MAG TPA: helix-turn-helix transcriptional regulator [Pyrinomonadaceae bacterium]|jgi:transcriptional regulator with XRE-family HTH domain
MGTRSARPKPDRLPEKLRQIRHSLGYTLEEMAGALKGVKKSPPSRSHVLRFETGEREPSLFVLLEYSRVARCPLELIVDDELDLKLAGNVKKKR